MTGAQLLVKALKEAGIKYIVGYTGGAIMPFFDEMEKQKNCFKFIMSRHEQGAAFIAQGISRGSRSTKNHQIGVCVSTSGPGATNMVTGVADAALDSIPLLTISGQVGTGVIGSDAFQESDITGIMMPITKQAYMIKNPESVEETVHEALFLSKTGRRGPVSIDLPKDIQFKKTKKTYEFNYKKYKPNIPGFKHHPDANQEKINKAVSMINKAEKPVIFCGHGVIQSNSNKELQKFAEKTNIPIAFTIHGISAIPADHQLNLGLMGMHGTVAANKSIFEADLIIAFGMRFDDRVTGKLSEYAKNTDIIHIEIDPSEIDKNVMTSIGINADVKNALEKFNQNPALIKKSRKNWFNKIKKFKQINQENEQKQIKKGIGKNGKLLMKTIISKLSEKTKGKDIIVSDVGQHQMISARYYNFQTFNSWFNSGGAGTMGAGLPMGIGVKIVRPKEQVWVIAGDGGFQMNIQELGTIMENNIDLKILILNNEFLGMVRQWQTLFFNKRYAGTPMKNPDFEKIAQSYKIAYSKVEKVNKIDTAIDQAIKHKGAYIIEFICDPDEIVLPMIPSGKTFDQMIINIKDQ